MQQVPAPLPIIALCLVVISVVLAGCESDPVSMPETGSVRILSSPSGGAIYLDDEYRGTTPATVTDVPDGTHNLEIRISGYDRWSAPITVRAGGMVNISATLSAIPVTAMPVTIRPTATVTPQRGVPEIHIDGYWTSLQGVSPSTSGPVPLLVHTEAFNVGDADAREVTVSANLYSGGHGICWKTVYLGTLKAGGHVATDTMITCPLSSNSNTGDLTIRFENVVVTS